MKVKKVNRYFCEFCKKSGGSGSHMSRHERHCTLNLNRICKMCGILEQSQPKLENLIKLLPNIKNYENTNEWGGAEYNQELYVKLNESLSKLREESGNCPVCIFAAIRQSKIPVYLIKDFDFKKECDDIFSEKNALAAEAEQRYAMYGN